MATPGVLGGAARAAWRERRFSLRVVCGDTFRVFHSASSSLLSKTQKATPSASKEGKLALPELEKSLVAHRSRPVSTSLPNDAIPQEILQSLVVLTHAGSCPEYLLPPKKPKVPLGTLTRPVDAVWQHPLRRKKFKYLIDQPISLTGAGRDISFLYDVKYVKGEAREKVLCPPRSQHSLQGTEGALIPLKPKKLTDTVVPEEFHIVANTGVSGLECYDDKYTTLLTDSENRLLLFPSMKPNRRVEVAQLNHVMETLLERAGAEVQEYKGPTKMHNLLHLLRREQTIYNTVFHELIRQVSVDCADRGELLAKIRERYVQMLDQVAKQMVDFYKDLVSQRVMDQRILEELHNFKNVIQELTKELSLVQEQDMKLTREAQRAHKDLAMALLEADRDARIVEDYHELYTMQRERMENNIRHLMSERDLWSSATYELALKVIARNRIILAKKLYLHEKGWHQHTKHLIILLSSQDTTDLALLQKLTESWRSLARKFKQEVEKSEEGAKQSLEAVKTGLAKWQNFLNSVLNEVLVPDKKKSLKLINKDFKAWQKLLVEEKNSLSGDNLAARYDTLRIIRHIEDNWVDVSYQIFTRHRDMDGKLPSEQKTMEDILKKTERYYSEFELRINGNNGVSWILSRMINTLDYCIFKIQAFEEAPVGQGLTIEWEEISMKINELLSQLDAFLTVIGSVPEVSGEFSGPILQIFIFNSIQEWLLKIDSEIKNGSSELQRQMEELHMAMIQWMVNLLIVMIPNLADQDSQLSADEGMEKHSVDFADLEVDAVGLTKKLYRFCTYLTSCCSNLVTTITLTKTEASEQNPTKDLNELVMMKRECYEWIVVCGRLLSQIKGSRVKLLKPSEKTLLLEEEEVVKEFIEPQIRRPLEQIRLEEEEEEEVEEEGEKEEFEKREEEKPPGSPQEGPLVRFVGEDENIHVRPLFEEQTPSSWRESAQQGTLAQKYAEAMFVIEQTQEKLLQVENRARQAEENFEEANEKLLYTLIRIQELESELRAQARWSMEREREETEEDAWSWLPQP